MKMRIFLILLSIFESDNFGFPFYYEKQTMKCEKLNFRKS